MDERPLPPAPLRAFGRGRVLVAGVTPLASRYSAELLARSRRERLVGLVSRLDEGALLEAVARTRPSSIVLGDAGDDRVMRILAAWRLDGFPVEAVESAYERLTGRVPLGGVGPASVLDGGFVRPGLGASVSRAIGWAIAAFGLLLVTPLLALLALLIKLDSPGPVFFVQERLGLGGRPFRLIKLRTMHVSSEHRSEWAGDNRERITRLGRWLRLLHLDELPQLINVLRGEMNLVGPRPHPVAHAALFAEKIPHYWLRCQTRPGLTGWAQVRFRYADGLHDEIEKMSYDLWWLKHHSLLLDLFILAATFRLLLPHVEAVRPERRLRHANLTSPHGGVPT